MARVWGRPEIKLKIALELDENEARALKEILSYNVESFLKVFYEKMGEEYLQRHEKGVRSLFATARQPLEIFLNRTDRAREVFEDDKEG
mgnify:CR=1 FL=1